jgi:5-methylcytosine-specific restriction endonuclease McrA
MSWEEQPTDLFSFGIRVRGEMVDGTKFDSFIEWPLVIVQGFRGINGIKCVRGSFQGSTHHAFSVIFHYHRHVVGMEFDVLDDFLIELSENVEYPNNIRANLPLFAAEAAPVSESHSVTFHEGSLTRVERDVRERSPEARNQCLAIHGYTCQCCGFNFEEVFGEAGKGIIDVHHLVPLSEGERDTDPRTDMMPICPNCHRMMHRREPPYRVEELRSMRKELE